jgi:hypothetical protein
VYTNQILVAGEAGDTLHYKYVIFNGANDAWEHLADNRFFVLSGEARTLPTVYFSDDSLVADTDFTLNFQVDMRHTIRADLFQPDADDTLSVRGPFNNWFGQTDLLTDADGDSIYTGSANYFGTFGEILEYKYAYFNETRLPADVFETLANDSNRTVRLNSNPVNVPLVSFSEAGEPMTHLQLLSTSPSRNANHVPRDANIVLNFDQLLDPATVNSDSIIIRGAQTGPIAGSFSVDGPIATFDPAADFKAGEVIHVLATTGLQAGDGTPLAAAVSYQFTTLVSPAPESPPSFNDHTITTGADGANSVFAADVDGDGHIDVLSASYDDGRIAWYENDGSGGFTAHTITTGADSASFSVFAADVDGDGDMDVLSASRSDDKIAWYENDGSANFTTHTITTGARGAVSVFAADVDGDGDMDIMSSYQNDETIAWYENDGSQNFTPHEVTSSPNYTFSVFAADVDGDGDMDLLSSLFEDTKIAWYENDGNANFTANTITTSAAGAHSVFAADVDGDGHMDVLSLPGKMTTLHGMRTTAAKTLRPMKLQAALMVLSQFMPPIWMVTGIWMCSRHQGMMIKSPGMRMTVRKISPLIP